MIAIRHRSPRRARWTCCAWSNRTRPSSASPTRTAASTPAPVPSAGARIASTSFQRPANGTAGSAPRAAGMPSTTCSAGSRSPFRRPSTSWRATRPGRHAPRMQMRARPNAQPVALPNWTQPAWQQAAQALVQEAEACLADDVAGAAARAYLAGRGLQPATWQAWRLGFHLAWQPVRREALPAITLPWFGADGTLQAVQYRYFGPGIARHDRFGQKAGGQRSLVRPAPPQRPGDAHHHRGGAERHLLLAGRASLGRRVIHRLAGERPPGPRQRGAEKRGPALPAGHRLARRARAGPAVADRIAPFNGTAIWSENGLDANDLLQRGLLAARLANAVADAGWEQS